MTAFDREVIAAYLASPEFEADLAGAIGRCWLRDPHSPADAKMVAGLMAENQHYQSGGVALVSGRGAMSEPTTEAERMLDEIRRYGIDSPSGVYAIERLLAEARATERARCEVHPITREEIQRSHDHTVRVERARAEAVVEAVRLGLDAFDAWARGERDEWGAEYRAARAAVDDYPLQ